MKKICILPAYNASKTLVSFLKILPEGLFDEIILVDDCSQDDTYAIAKTQGNILVYRTIRNLGYGGNLKMCLGIALEHGGNIVIELHPDGEYGTDGILPALKKVREGSLFVLGDRFADRNLLRSGMPFWKYPFTRFLTFIDNLFLGTHIGDIHQGFRVYTREFIESVNFRANSNIYLFSFEIIAQAAFKHIPIANVPISTSYKGKKRGASFKASIIYSLGTFKVLLLFILAKLGVISRLFRKQDKVSICPNCKSNYLVEQRLSIGKFNIFFCKICLNGFTRSVPKNMEVYYPPTYWQYVGLLGYIRKITFDFFQKRRKKWIEKYLPKGGVILDVGSGEGNFGKSLNGGFRIVNIEGPFASLMNAEVIRTDFFKWKSEQRFDAVCFWESLEHTDSPQEYLEKASSLLKKGGFVFIEYPRYESLEAKIFGKNWFHLDVPRHLAHLTDKGIKILVNRAGLTCLEKTSILSLDYGPAGFIMSAISIFRSIGFLPLLIFSPLILIGFILQIFLSVFGESPIGLIVSKRK